MRKQTVKTYEHPITGNILEMTSRCDRVIAIRLFDGLTWHTAPVRSWGDNWEQELNTWHNAIVESV